MQYTYTYDAVNRLSTEELGGVTKTFTYDVRSQLTGDGTGTYGYDNAGNRNNSSQTITTGNRLDLDANWDYSYDDEGNLTGKVSVAMPTVTWTYTWDVNNRMVAAVKSAGSNLYSVDYKYDVFGNRIEQIEDADGAGAGASVTTRFAWEGAGVLQDAWGNRTSPVGTENWNIWADLNGSNGLVMRYVRGDEVDQLFSRVKADGTVAHYLTDRMQSTRQMLDASGTVANTITYDGFGNVLSETDAPFGDRWKWTGREYNNYTGLQYNRARYFSGESGRWASEDPKRHSGMEPYNLHRYLGNHTVGLNDSSGNDWAGLPGGGPPLHFLPDTGTPPPEMPPLPPRPPGTIAHPVTGEPMVIPDMHILRPRPIDPIFNRDDPINSDDPNRYPPLLPGQPGERPPPGTPGTPGGPGEPSIVLQSKLLELAIDKFVDDSNLTTGSLKELPYARKIIPFYNFLIDLIPSKYLPRPPATGNPDPGFPRPVPGFPGPSVGVSGVSKNGATIKIER